MEFLKNFANGRLNSVDYLESMEDKKSLYQQVLGACELYGSFGDEQMKEAKAVWEDFSWRFFEKIYGE